MKPISLKLKEKVLEKTNEICQYFDVSRNSYINDALEEYNKLQKRKWLAIELQRESALLKDNSMAVLKSLNLISDDY